MKRCPACDQELVSELYAGAKVERCPTCRGVFVVQSRLDRIKREGAQAPDALKAEAAAEHGSDTRHQIRCPACRGVMDKRPLASRYTTLTIDRCRACPGVWLDGGELALVQLIHAASARGRDVLELQRRMQALEADPERKRRFEAAMAELPEALPGTEVPSSNRMDADLMIDLLEWLFTKQLD